MIDCNNVLRKLSEKNISMSIGTKVDDLGLILYTSDFSTNDIDYPMYRICLMDSINGYVRIEFIDSYPYI